jgi:UDP-N-acetylmuramate dehydrogenase
MISAKHANFIVNTGGATAGDVIALMELARQKVKEKRGVDLEPEIRIVGT